MYTHGIHMVYTWYTNGIPTVCPINAIYKGCSHIWQCSQATWGHEVHEDLRTWAVWMEHEEWGHGSCCEILFSGLWNLILGLCNLICRVVKYDAPGVRMTWVQNKLPHICIYIYILYIISIYACRHMHMCAEPVADMQGWGYSLADIYIYITRGAEVTAPR